jgi:hypothetical protein
VNTQLGRDEPSGLTEVEIKSLGRSASRTDSAYVKDRTLRITISVFSNSSVVILP